ncbi:hypothetical protein CgunFtcFv8_025243 [Champsocephalus gunnari]|uniref:Uncharacterized protein n=1 Tax=Champsocephalus gunnari TaxID=52237 RepID=A0AAN8CAY8_CHAGU|nr:hypothetical protein CgunFtcFv8_025243 [Champsocephalus gunnari]
MKRRGENICLHPLLGASRGDSVSVSDLKRGDLLRLRSHARPHAHQLEPSPAFILQMQTGVLSGDIGINTAAGEISARDKGRSKFSRSNTSHAAPSAGDVSITCK